MCKLCAMIDIMDKVGTNLSTKHKSDMTETLLSFEAKTLLSNILHLLTASNPEFDEKAAVMTIMGYKYGYNQGLKEKPIVSN